jgi:hypothetical protein
MLNPNLLVRPNLLQPSLKLRNPQVSQERHQQYLKKAGALLGPSSARASRSRTTYATKAATIVRKSRKHLHLVRRRMMRGRMKTKNIMGSKMLIKKRR